MCCQATELLRQGSKVRAEQEELHSFINRVPSSPVYVDDAFAPNGSATGYQISDATVSGDTAAVAFGNEPTSPPATTAVAQYDAAAAERLYGTSAGVPPGTYRGGGIEADHKVESQYAPFFSKKKWGPVQKLKGLLSELVHYRYNACIACAAKQGSVLFPGAGFPSLVTQEQCWRIATCLCPAISAAASAAIPAAAAVAIPAAVAAAAAWRCS